jgi:pilus assembly protein Flp/PilA
MRRFFRIFKDEQGATAVEYALILAMIFMAMVVGVASVGISTSALWTNVSAKVSGT